MSAAVAREVTPVTGPLGTPESPSAGAPSGRPRLTLVQGGRATADVHRGSVRLTRRARLLITCAVALAIVATVTSMAVRAAASGVEPTVTVQPGQTLSQIAGSQLPELPISEGVVRIQLANHLNSTDIHAGQQLSIPTR